jgi:hypothetical protein
MAHFPPRKFEGKVYIAKNGMERGRRMAKSNEDLSREIAELKNELKQMREIVNMLFSIIIESEEDDEEYAPYPGLGSSDNLRLNN